MLVLSRRLQEQIVIGDDIRITLVKIKGGEVRLGIDAPRDKKILRVELDRHPEPVSDQEPGAKSEAPLRRFVRGEEKTA